MDSLIVFVDVVVFLWFDGCAGFMECICFSFRKGDYYRYLAEFKVGNEKKEAADQSLKAYEVCFCGCLFLVW